MVVFKLSDYNLNIQWYPGHMTRTFRALKTTLPSIDAAVILLDARIPYSSTNPQLLQLLADKPKLFVLNKADLADKDTTELWLKHLNKSGMAIAVSSKSPSAAKQVISAVKILTADIETRRAAKGITGMKTGLLVCGIPNVGKSTLINVLCGSKRARAADKPGVTRGLQRISLAGYDLVDVPGLLWPKFENNTVACNLAFIGSINDDILGREELAAHLLQELAGSHKGALCERFKLEEQVADLPMYELLEEIGRKRGMLLRGAEVDIERVAIMVLDEFRAAKFGRITLEKPTLQL